MQRLPCHYSARESLTTLTILATLKLYYFISVTDKEKTGHQDKLTLQKSKLHADLQTEGLTRCQFKVHIVQIFPREIGNVLQIITYFHEMDSCSPFLPTPTPSKNEKKGQNLKYIILENYTFCILVEILYNKNSTFRRKSFNSIYRRYAYLGHPRQHKFVLTSCLLLFLFFIHSNRLQIPQDSIFSFGEKQLKKPVPLHLFLIHYRFSENISET